MPQHGGLDPEFGSDPHLWSPLLSSSATASRLNSEVNSRLVFAIKHLPRSQGAYAGVSVESGDDHHNLEEIARAVAPVAHAVLMLSQAGWHTIRKLPMPDKFTLL